LMNRGFGVEGWQEIDSDGVVSSAVTDELHMRHYYKEWLRIMTEGMDQE